MSRLDIPRLFLSRCAGVVHVGAHTGQEASFYGKLGIPVLWLEAVPAYHESLRDSIKVWPLQKSACALVSSVEGKKVIFHLTGADGQSSSIYPLSDLGRSSWSIDETNTIELATTTLDTILDHSPMPMADGILIDVQGAEYDVLVGAKACLRQFTTIVCEVSTEEFYTGQSKYSSVANILRANGFFPVTIPHKSHANVVWARPFTIAKLIVQSPTILLRILKWYIYAKRFGPV